MSKKKSTRKPNEFEGLDAAENILGTEGKGTTLSSSVDLGETAWEGNKPAITLQASNHSLF